MHLHPRLAFTTGQAAVSGPPGACCAHILFFTHRATQILAQRLLPLPPSACHPAVARSVRAYLSECVLEKIDHKQTSWLGELRMATALFINLKVGADSSRRRVCARGRAGRERPGRAFADSVVRTRCRIR
jgi:hypothetical protein